MKITRTRKTIATAVLAGAGITGAGIAHTTGAASADTKPGCQKGAVNVDTIVGDIFKSNVEHKDANEDLPTAVQRNLTVAYWSEGNSCDEPKGNHVSVVLVKADATGTINVHGALVQRAVYMNNEKYEMYLINRGAVTGLQGKAENTDYAIAGDKERRSDNEVAITGYDR